MFQYFRNNKQVPCHYRLTTKNCFGLNQVDIGQDEEICQSERRESGRKGNKIQITCTVLVKSDFKATQLERHPVI